MAEPQYPQDFDIVWNGERKLPNSHTKGELLGSYETYPADARLRFNSRKRSPMDKDDSDNR